MRHSTRFTIRKFLTLSLALALTLTMMSAGASVAQAGPAAKGKAPAKHMGGQKNIEFEDGFVEGMNKRPGDYASKATKWRDKKKDHLYNRQISFERDLDESLREMRYTQ